MVPPLGNELIALLKDSSLVTVIAANDILYAGKIVAGAISFGSLIYSCSSLSVLTWVFSKLIGYIEKRFSNSYVPSQRKKSLLISSHNGWKVINR